MRDGDQRGGGHGRDARDARRDGERDPRLGQRERLLAAAAEDERVAALEADDVEPGPPVVDEQRVDRLLRQRRARDHERVLGRLLDELRRDERVVHEHVAGANELEPAGRDQPGVARAGADEVDGHESARSTRPLEVRLALVVGRKAHLRPRAELPQLAREVGVRRPDLGGDLVAEPLREGG